jgi:uncharacterized protein (DUF362 family)
MRILRELGRLPRLREFKAFLRTHSLFLLKPNLCTVLPPPATTPKHTVSQVASMIGKTGKPCFLIESDQAVYSFEEKIAALGFDKLNIPAVNAREFWSNPIWTTAFKSGAVGVVNLPVIKTTGLNIGMTCAIKNLFGLLPEKRKAKYHKSLSTLLPNLYRAFTPHTYTVVDGSICMEGKGAPINGSPVKFDPYYLCGTDMMEIDVYVCTKIIGLPELPFYLKPVPVRSTPPYPHPKFGHFAVTETPPWRMAILNRHPGDTDKGLPYLARRLFKYMGKAV